MSSVSVLAKRQIKHRTKNEALDFESIFQATPEPMFVMGPDGVLLSYNQLFLDLTGYPAAKLSEKTVDDLGVGSRPLSFKQILAPGRYEDISFQDYAGTTRVVDLMIKKAGEKNSPLWIGVIRNLTQKKEIESELLAKHQELRQAYVELEKKTSELQATQQTLVQAGKMAALGELAAGIAHELNQPLTGIKGYCQELQYLIRESKADPKKTAEEMQGHLVEVISNADKMATIIGYLRTFTRKSTEKFEMTDVHHAIDESVKMMARQLKSRGIEVVKEYDRKLPLIYAIPLQLEQVFINLCANARDAIESTQRSNGLIKIKTRLVNELVEIRFEDNGCGMTEKNRTKIFNPFFTTKEVGKGMGLGLSLSFGILTKIQASVVVESELGAGTVFIIRIPRDFRECG